jgi:hypothetical protein
MISHRSPDAGSTFNYKTSQNRQIELVNMQINRYAEFALFVTGVITVVLDRLRLARTPIGKVAVDGMAAQVIALILMFPFTYAVAFSRHFWINAHAPEGVPPFPMGATARAGPILLFCIVAGRLLRRLYNLANIRGDWHSGTTTEATRAEEEFRDAAQRHVDWSRKVVWSVFMAGLIGFPTALVSVLIIVRLLDRGHVTEIVAVVGLLMGSVGLVIVVMSVAVWCHQYRSKRDPQLVCPCCGGGLFPYYMEVIPTGNCPHCGGCVYGDGREGKKLPATDPDF